MDIGQIENLMAQDKDFQDFWNEYKVDLIRFPKRKLATFRLWRTRNPPTRRAILERVRKEGAPRWKNPYFYVQDFLDSEPVFLNGDEPGDLVQVRYNGIYKICTRETMQEFGLEYVRDWKTIDD